MKKVSLNLFEKRCQRSFGVVLVLVALLCGCALFPEDRDDINQEIGTIAKLSSDAAVFVIQPESDSSVRYLPSNLPQVYQQHGLRVLFSGHRQPLPQDPPWSEELIPIELTTIEIFETNLRIHNASQYDFTSVQIDPYNQLTLYGDIKHSEITAYQPFEIAYRYAYVRLFIDGNEFIIQPIDFVGETPLGKGQFTYELNVFDFQNRALSISVKRED
ncbi:MAG: hypothetical protein ACE5HS_18700 [bacterium]